MSTKGGEHIMSKQNNNIKAAIEEAERELTGLLEKLKEYDETKVRIANIETFIKAGKAMVGVSEQSSGVGVISPSPELFPEKKSESDLIEKPHLQGITEILKETGRALSLREIAGEFHNRKWKLSEKNGRQVLRATVLRYPDKFKKIEKGLTAYYELQAF